MLSSPPAQLYRGLLHDVAAVEPGVVVPDRYTQAESVVDGAGSSMICSEVGSGSSRRARASPPPVRARTATTASPVADSASAGPAGDHARVWGPRWCPPGHGLRCRRLGRAGRGWSWLLLVRGARRGRWPVRFGPGGDSPGRWLRRCRARRRYRRWAGPRGSGGRRTGPAVSAGGERPPRRPRWRPPARPGRSGGQRGGPGPVPPGLRRRKCRGGQVDRHPPHPGPRIVIARHHRPAPVGLHEGVLGHLFGHDPPAAEHEGQPHHPPVLGREERLEGRGGDIVGLHHNRVHTSLHAAAPETLGRRSPHRAKPLSIRDVAASSTLSSRGQRAMADEVVKGRLDKNVCRQLQPLGLTVVRTSPPVVVGRSPVVDSIDW